MINAILLATALAGAEPAVQAELLAQQIAKADWAGAAATARELERAVATKAPLEIVDIQALSGPPRGLGMYSALFGGKLQGDELVVYAQVRNHGLRLRADFYELHLVSDLVILDTKGNELAKDEGFGESRFTSRATHRDTFVVVAMGTKGLPRGTYKLRLVLHDRIGKKSTQAEVPFEIP